MERRTLSIVLLTLTHICASSSQHCPVQTPCFCDHHGRSYSFPRRVVCSQSSSFPHLTSRADGDVFDVIVFMFAGLRSVPGRAFGDVIANAIDMQGNNFGDAISEDAFAHVGRQLQDLNMAWSNITALPGDVFRGMLELRNLTLSENRLQYLSNKLFQDLRSLENLVIAGNPLISLPPTLLRFQTNLFRLDMGYCSLKTLSPQLFVGLWNLKILDLRGNQLMSITPGTFEDLLSLRLLLLSHNPITVLQAGTLRGLVDLEKLELKESMLEVIERGVFYDTIRLSMLDLGDNHIRHLQEGVLEIPHLDILDLDGNQLTALPRDISHLTKLTHLDVSYNQLTTLDHCLLFPLRKIEFINLRENPFICNCTIYWLRDLQEELTHGWDMNRHLPFIPARCVAPSPLHGVPITNWTDPQCIQQKAHLGARCP